MAELAAAAGFEDPGLWEEACRAAGVVDADTEQGTQVYRLTLTEWQLVTRYAGQLHLLRTAVARGAPGCDAYLEALRKRQRLDDRAAVRRQLPRVLAGV